VHVRKGGPAGDGSAVAVCSLALAVGAVVVAEV